MADSAQTRRVLLRTGLVLPFVLLLFAGVREILSSPFDWSSEFGTNPAGLAYDIPRWVASVSPIIVAAIPLATGVIGIRSTLQRTSQLFQVTPLLLAIGSFAILALAAALFGLSAQAADEVFDYTLIGADGGDGSDAGSVKPVASLAITTLASVLFGGCAAASALVYLSGISPEGSGRYDKRPDERDAMAEIIASTQPKS
jgi:hypothetical protein